MTTLTEALTLADEISNKLSWVTNLKAAAELRRLVSFNQQLMDEVARLNKAVAAEREACARICETEWSTTQEHVHGLALADMIRARGNT